VIRINKPVPVYLGVLDDGARVEVVVLGAPVGADSNPRHQPAQAGRSHLQDLTTKIRFKMSSFSLIKILNAGICIYCTGGFGEGGYRFSFKTFRYKKDL